MKNNMSDEKYFKETEVIESEIFNSSNVVDFKEKLKSQINAPFVGVGITAIDENKPSVMLSISLDQKENWPGKIFENSRYAKFYINKEGVVEKFSGYQTPKLRKFRGKTQEDIITKLNMYLTGEKFEDGGDIQVPYHSASEVCNSLDTLVPYSMAPESRKFNDSMRTYILNKYSISVEEYVAMKLHYKSVDDLCYDPTRMDESGNRIVRFAKEQIDAIATAIFCYEEKGDGTIIADQTGVGKGRTAAGILRYAILELGLQPFFFTEKQHLINDIYRDFYDIGFDAGVPVSKRPGKETAIRKDYWSDSEIMKLVRKELKSSGDDESCDLQTIDFDWPEDFSPSLILEYLKKGDEHPRAEQISEVLEQVIEEMRIKLNEEGYITTKQVPVSKEEYSKNIKKALEEGRHILKPFFPNRKDIKNQDGDIIYPALDQKEVKKILGYYEKGGKMIYDWTNPGEQFLPKEFALITMPYSQISGMYASAKTTKMPGKQILKPLVRFSLKYANDNILILDEAHTASGVRRSGETSNTFEVISQMIESSKTTTYLSATFAKTELNMPLYSLKTSIKESGLSNRDMIETFAAGGDALKEAVSTELVRNGQLIRREKKIVGSTEYIYSKDEESDPNGGRQQRLRLDRVSELYWEIIEFQGKVSGIIKEYRKNLPSVIENDNKLVGSKDEIEKPRSIKARTFEIFNFFLLGLKVDMAVEQAVKRLSEGRKVVISVSNTMEAFLNRTSKTYLSAKEDDGYEIGDTIENDFKLYLAHILWETMKWTKIVEVVDDQGDYSSNSEKVYVFDDTHPLSTLITTNLLSEYRELLKKVLSTTTGVPISPIDEIVDKIEKRGFKVGEITGRQMRLSFSGANYKFGVIERRVKPETFELIRDYNINESDVLLINQSGAVGVSMHARPVGRARKVHPITESQVETENGIQTIQSGWPLSLKDKEEVKKRAMIITQMELDITKEVQKLGRISRTGQVYPPEYCYVVSVVPSESRITAMMQRKLASLMSITAGSSSQGESLFSYDDFFGRTAIKAFNETAKDMNLGMIAETGDDVREFTKQLYFRPYEYQKDFYETFAKRLKEAIEYEKSTGTYVDKLAIKDYKATTIDEFPYYVGDNNAKTSFGRHSVLQKSEVTVYAPKNTEYTVEKAINDKMLINFTKKDENGGFDKIDTRFYTDLSKFKSVMKSHLEDFLKSKKQDHEETLQDLARQEEQQNLLISEAENNIKALGEDFATAVKVKETLREVEKKISEKKDEITDAMSSNDFTKISELGVEMNALQTEKNSLSKQLEAFGDISEKEYQSRDWSRTIRNGKERIERIQNERAREIKDVIEYSERKSNLEKYVERIGFCAVYTEYEETKVYDEDDNGNEIVKEIKQTPKFSEDCVIVGVTIPTTWDRFIASQIEVHLVTVTAKIQVPLSKLFAKLSEEEISKGAKPLNVIEMKNDGSIFYNFEHFWDKLVGKTDTGERVEKWFIRGSILKTYKLSGDNGHIGMILKYTTDKNQDKLGIEIKNMPAKDNWSQSTYDRLNQRYNRETAMQYPVLFDGNSFNLEHLFDDYLYWFFVKRFYDFRESGNDVNIFKRFNEYRSKVLFQVSTSSGFSCFEVAVSQEMIEHSLDLSRRILEGQPLPEMMSKQSVIDSIETVDYGTESTKEMTLMMNLYENVTQQPITDEVAKIRKRNSSFPELSVTGWGGRFHFDGGDFFYRAMIIDIERANEIVRRGSVEVDNVLKLSYSQFRAIMSKLEELNSKFTFATSSGFFESKKDLFVFNEYIDEMIDDVVQTPDGALLVTSETDANKIVDNTINELVELLTKI